MSLCSKIILKWKLLLPHSFNQSLIFSFLNPHNIIHYPRKVSLTIRCFSTHIISKHSQKYLDKNAKKKTWVTLQILQDSIPDFFCNMFPSWVLLLTLFQLTFLLLHFWKHIKHFHIQYFKLCLKSSSFHYYYIIFLQIIHKTELRLHR